MEKFLGRSKYDGKIRRITLLKEVSDLLDMEDGDYVYYFEKDGEIILRKEPGKVTWKKEFTFDEAIEFLKTEEENQAFNEAFGYVWNIALEATEKYKKEGVVEFMPAEEMEEKFSEKIDSALAPLDNESRINVINAITKATQILHEFGLEYHKLSKLNK